jgi:hypothetical protein
VLPAVAEALALAADLRRAHPGDDLAEHAAALLEHLADIADRQQKMLYRLPRTNQPPDA